MCAWLALLPLLFLTACGSSPKLATSQLAFVPEIRPASDEALAALKRIQLPAGLTAALWAAEPLLANPVAIATDERGRWFVCETFRHTDGVLDIRGRMHWLDEELASQSVAERIAIMQRHLTPEKIQAYAAHAERLRLLEDRDHDGRADHATVFATGFNHLEDGIASGVLARQGRVYFANIPALYLLHDSNDDGVADDRQTLLHGFGVRVGFLGHDLHGLRFGPDGKLYFSIGDRGFNVPASPHPVAAPETGAILRCNPDGSQLEIVHLGLRNPQELAFDRYGNLFTGDNNSDGGDKARWVQVVEGGDSGWRIGWQFLTQPNPRGAWISEKMDQPLTEPDLQPAYILPPLLNIGSGPSGLTYYPGTSLPDQFRDHFFLCDFRGSSPASGVHCFKLEPHGASFRVIKLRPFVWNLLAVDADFGIDGGLYIADWVEGWRKPAKGRIYRIHDPSLDADPIVLQTHRLLSEGMAHRSLEELISLLAHADQRVRQEAQFALAQRGAPAIPALQHVALTHSNQLARIHALWALGQLRPVSTPALFDPLLSLLADPDPEIQSQSAKLFGDHRHAPARGPLLALLSSTSARVQFCAALALGKLRHLEAAPALIQLLRQHNDQDPYLRHAVVMALTWLDDPNLISAAARDPSPAVRLAALLTLRRWQHASLAQFLNDPEPRLVLEAARAIHDLPLTNALPQLAALLDRSGPDPLLRRVLNANFRLGGSVQAKALAAFAQNTNHTPALRAEAVERLGQWPNPSGRDALTGLWRPVPARDAQPAFAALEPCLPTLFQAPAQVQLAALAAIRNLQLTAASPILLNLTAQTNAPTPIRVAALECLAAFLHPHLQDTLAAALKDPDLALRQAATRLQAQTQPSKSLPLLQTTLTKGSIPEKQTALATLPALADPKADALLATWMDQLTQRKVPAPLQLDVLDAAAKRNTPLLQEKLQTYENLRDPQDPLRSHRECLEGGDPDEGRKIFLERMDVYCARCHAIGAQGAMAGPDLAGIGSKRSRDYLLESILLPNRQIAEGFETSVITLQNGVTYAGIITKSTEATLELNSPEDGVLLINKAHITSQESGRSGMPDELGQILSKRDVRHLVEFLATLR